MSNTMLLNSQRNDNSRVLEYNKAMPRCEWPACTKPKSTRISQLGTIWHYKWCTWHASKVNKEAKLKLSKIKNGDRVVNNGYVYTRNENGKLVPRYRLVMENKLGRKLIKGESVHHVNGIKSDDRAENLELWVGAIRYGQRATDLKCPHCGEVYLEARNGN